MAFTAITMKAKPTTTPANMAAATNMTSPHARSYSDNREHGPSVPCHQTRKAPQERGSWHRTRQAGAPDAGHQLRSGPIVPAEEKARLNRAGHGGAFPAWRQNASKDFWRIDDA
jgi:hypothetical protein